MKNTGTIKAEITALLEEVKEKAFVLFRENKISLSDASSIMYAAKTNVSFTDEVYEQKTALEKNTPFK